MSKRFLPLANFKNSARGVRNWQVGVRRSGIPARLGGDFFEAFLLRPIIGLHGDKRSRAVFFEMPEKRFAEIRRVSQAVVLDLPPMPGQLLPKGPQGGEVEDAFDFMRRPRIARLDQQHPIDLRVSCIERGVLQRELIAQDEQGVFHWRIEKKKADPCESAFL